MSPPLVSVIIPCRNAGPMLRPALRSVIDQTYPNLEILFVDNGSTDASAAVAGEMAAAQSRPFSLLSCPEAGANLARNHGFARARGDFVQWMDADDRLDPDKIALQVAALQARASDDIAYGDWTTARGEPGRPANLRRVTLNQVDDQFLRTLAGVWYPPHLYLLRRAAADRLQAVQAWKPDRPVATDVEYSGMAALLGLVFRHVPGAHVCYNVWSPGQISGATPYAARAAALEAIYARFAAFAGTSGCGIRLTNRHRVLLSQNWRVWRMPPGSATLSPLPGRRFQLRPTAGGRPIALRPREAAIARALLADPRPLCSAHRALELMQSAPDVGDDPVAIVETLERFQREGFLAAVDLP